MIRVIQPVGILGAAFCVASFLPGTAPLSRAPVVVGKSGDATAGIASFLCGTRNRPAGLQHSLLIASAMAAPASAGSAIPLYKDLADTSFVVDTRSRKAQQYFSQGLMLSYGFNHAGAVRSFRESQRLDPGCAMCWWGEAVALGPNINAPMDARDREAALRAMERAMLLRDRASPVERALIEAISERYSRDPQADRAALDSAYADAMLAVTGKFPANDDVAVLAAEAVMDTTPWNYWEADKRTPVGRSGEALRLVAGVLERNPRHLQAAHLYVHLLEASDPAKAEAVADRLSASVAPSAAHLVHMPAHIYINTGRYADAIRVNVAAARADEAFLRTAGDSGLVRYGYYPHNIHFIVVSAQMAGDMKTAIREARRLRRVLSPETSAQIAWVQVIDAAPYFATAQFARAADILAMPPPDPRLPYAIAMRHYARATAYAKMRDRDHFESELAAMGRIKSSGTLANMVAQGVPANNLLTLAEVVARGRFATANGRYDEAIAHYRRAVTLEQTIPYMEPAFWSYPVRQSLGAALYLAGRYDEAGEQFRTTLAKAPGNGWALYGLARSEAAMGHKPEAAAARKAFGKAWLGRSEWLRMDRI